MRYLIWSFLGLLIAAGCGGSQPTLEVSGRSDEGGMAVPVELDAAAVTSTDDVLTVEQSGAGEVVLQKAPALFASEPQGQKAYCAVLNADAEGSTLSFVDRGGSLRLEEGGQPVLTYNYGMQLEEGVPEEYKRSAYVHPVWSLSGTRLTDDFPEDHYHHRGLSWMWPRVRVAGETYDLWHIRGVRQVFERWLAKEEGPVCATLGVQNAWQLSDGGKILDEQVWIRAFRATEKGRAVDVRLTLEAVDQSVELLGQENQNKGYGGLSFRFAPRKETIITTPDGAETADSDHKRTAWADASGRFGGADAFSGVAIFQHESNPDFPAAWTLRHYGFLGVAWPGNAGTTLQPGEPVTLRYRIWIHPGTAEEGRVAQAYEAFRQPPSVQVGE